MKALVATEATQTPGERAEFGCVEGELVWMVASCPLSRRYPDGPCSCGRTFRGTFTDGESATALVRDVEGLTRTDLVLALRACHDDNPACTCLFDPHLIADQLLSFAQSWPAGMVVERRLDRIAPRAFIAVEGT